MGVLIADAAGTRTALNVYADEPHDFDAESVETAELFPRTPRSPWVS
jgi:hypothetical protein